MRVRYLTRIQNLDMVTHRPTVRHRQDNVLSDKFLNRIHKQLVVTILHHQSSQLTRQTVEQHHVAVAHLVEHRDDVPLSEGCALSRLHRVHIRDITLISDGIVIDEVTDVLNQAVVADNHIAKRGIPDARMLHKTLTHLKVFLKHTQPDITIERDIFQRFSAEPLSHQDLIPVLSLTASSLKNANLLKRQ